MNLLYTVKENNNNTSIHSILKNEFNISTRLLSTLIKNHCIMLNQSISDTRVLVKSGDIIEINFNYEEDNSNIIPKNIPLDILYEDEWLLIVNKPSGIAIHPSILHYDNSLSNGIKFYFDSIRLHKKIRPINRLDLNTSGIVIFAKCEYIQQCLTLQMQNNTFQKYYLAWAEGIFQKKEDTLNFPIARKENSIIERCVNFQTGQNSITHYKVLKENKEKNISLLECKLETGRTHQIRVHLSYIGHPLVGDTLYR